jgi:phage terminase large subunit
MIFQRTKAINKLLALKKRKKVIQGGTWAGKTFCIVSLLINKASKIPNRKITIVAETIPALKGGALSDFITIMQSTGRWVQLRYNATDRAYTFYNGSIIEFKSFDTIGKAQAAGKRTDLFINEAPYIPFEIADALMMRTSGEIYIDFNPTAEFWAHSEIVNQDDSDFIVLKYTDNEALPNSILKELMMKVEKAKTSEYWKNWCKVYIDGEIGSLEGVIFSNWKQIDIIPKEAVLIGYGLDFGYTNDPTSLIEVYKWNDKRILNEVLYQTGLVNSEIAKFILNTSVPVFADSAEPKSIEEIKRLGIKNIKGVEKGSDSIKFGIQTMQSQEYLVTSTSRNLIRELRLYSWLKDKLGKSMNVPMDAFNHAIDAIRYHEMMTLGIIKKINTAWGSSRTA